MSSIWLSLYRLRINKHLDNKQYVPHAEGGFGVTFNDITTDAAFYTSTSRFVAWLGAFSQERQSLWLPKDDLKDASTRSSPPLVLLRDIHDGLLAKYDCKDSVPPSAAWGEGSSCTRFPGWSTWCISAEGCCPLSSGTQSAP